MKALSLVILVVAVFLLLFFSPTIEVGDVVVPKREFSLRSGYDYGDSFTCRLAKDEEARVISTSFILLGASGGRENVVEVEGLASKCFGWAPESFFHRK